MTKMLQILIKGQKVTKCEQCPKRHKFWSKVKKLHDHRDFTRNTSSHHWRTCNINTSDNGLETSCPPYSTLTSQILPTGKLWRECSLGLPSIDAPSLPSWPLPIHHTHFANAASVTQNKHWNHVIYTDSLFPSSHSAFFPLVSNFHHGCNKPNREKEKGRHLPL